MKLEPPPALTQGQQLVECLQALEIEKMPAKVIEQAQWCLLDSVGCGLFGSTQPWSRIMAAEMFAGGSRGASTVFGHAATLGGPAAALCNGTATHGFERLERTTRQVMVAVEASTDLSTVQPVIVRLQTLCSRLDVRSKAS